ncbi:kelch-like protein 24 isoform X3 [Pomacea canaliculata]|uniref:kelch-like protein 24 isoform X3 n=1 Tax=Pomacea canaliculata TaxID=400727 RepID=UPI000D739342|nr:kelch-like protein 24 isoform X3 [Pomacea canaliculata]
MAQSAEPVTQKEDKIKVMLQRTLSKELTTLLTEESLVDLVVIVEGQRFPCHGVVLASFSGYFRSMLISQWKERTSREVTLDSGNVTKEVFQQILDIIYKQQFPLSFENAKEILKSVCYLQIECIEEICVQFLSENMMPETCLGLWEFADQLALEELAHLTFREAVKNFTNVIKHQEFLKISKTKLLKLAATLSTDLKMNMYLCGGILKWMTEDWDHKKQYLEELLHFVNFPLLPPRALNDLRRNTSFPWHNDHKLKELICEAVTYHLEGNVPGDDKVKQDILSRQCNVSENSDLFRGVLILGGSSDDGEFFETLKAFSIPDSDQTDYDIHTLSSVPWTRGNAGLAACVWRNDVYVSGGSDKPTSFVVYRPGTGKWETLADLPHSRQNHIMAAVNSKFFILGGADPASDKALHNPCPEILLYELQTKSWSTFGHLKVPVQHAASAVLGHMVYIFGGKDGEDKSIADVQCLNTLSGEVYICGHLPSPTFGNQAVSDGGTVFVVTSEGDVLEMIENYALTDEIEQHIVKDNSCMDKEPGQANLGCCVPEGSFVDGPGVASVCDQQTKLDGTSEVAAPDEMTDVTSDISDIMESEKEKKTLLAISFKWICQHNPTQNFGIFCDNDIYMWGGCNNKGNLLNTMRSVSLSSRKTMIRHTILPCGMTHFAAFIVNIPKVFVAKDKCLQSVFLFIFNPEKLPTSKKRKVKNVDWSLHLSTNADDGCLYAKLEYPSRQSCKVSCRLITNALLRATDYTFTLNNYKSNKLKIISMEDLRAADGPYLEDGLAALEVFFSFITD